MKKRKIEISRAGCAAIETLAGGSAFILIMYRIYEVATGWESWHSVPTIWDFLAIVPLTAVFVYFDSKRETGGIN